MPALAEFGKRPRGRGGGNPLRRKGSCPCQWRVLAGTCKRMYLLGVGIKSRRRHTKITDAEAGETDFVRDDGNRMTSLTDVENNTTRWTSDTADRVTVETDPSLKAVSYGHHDGMPA